jgi:hypothetical protein
MTSTFKPVLIASLLLLAGAAQYFVYAAYVRPREKAAQDLAMLTEVLRVENVKKPAVRAQENRGVTIPDLLSRVQELAAQSGLTLDGAEPLAGDGEQFKLRLSAGYGNFLEFLAQFETLQVNVTGFDVAPAMEMPGMLDVSLSFSHIAASVPIGPERIKTFMVRLKEAELRDPFNPDAGALHLMDARNASDPTWTFRLTSISQIGKLKYATIDGRDYNVGDRLQAFVIGAIGDNDVTLIGMEGGEEHPHVLTFRNRPKGHT